MTPEEKIEYFHANPPGILDEFSVLPVTLPGMVFDGHGVRLNVVFKISCRCGCQIQLVVPESLEEEIYYHSEFVTADRFCLACTSCGKKTLLFDPALHDYNAEIEKMEGRDIEAIFRSGNIMYTGGYSCQHCGTNEFEVFTRFEYSEDLFEVPEFADRPQEFFSWCTVVVKCSKCKHFNRPVECECA